MRLKTWLWLVLALSPAPLFFNCHRAVNFAPVAATSSVPESDDLTLPGDSNSGTRSIASEDAQTPRAKVELLPSSLVHKTGIQSKNGGDAATAADVIPAGERLFAVVDNSCLQNAGGKSLKISNAFSLSTKAAAAATGRGPKLKIQAYPFILEQDKPLDELTAEAEADPCVLHVHTDKKILRAVPPPDRNAHVMYATDDPGLTYQQHLTFIKATKGWDVFFSPARGIDKDVVVAVVDSGVDYTHPDLQENVFTDADGLHGYDFENNDADPMDDCGHGTHVAGLIGAVSSNGIGVSGVMGQNVKLLIAKVTDKDGGGYPSVISNGIRWAADSGADVINLSLGMPGESASMRDAVQYAVNKGVVVVTAAGNDSKEITATNFDAPAGYSATINGLIAVGSVDASSGARSSFSNWSTTYVQIAAPGSGQIVSTYLNKGYRSMEGTSMASPITAGAVALLIGFLKSDGVSYTPVQIKNLLVLGSRTDVSLTGTFRNGTVLDLDLLGKVVKWRYAVDGDGGTENPFQ